MKQCVAALITLGTLIVRGDDGTARIRQDFGNTPLYFEENRGQADKPALYIARAGNLTEFVTKDGWTLVVGSETISMHVVGANPNERPAPDARVEGVSNYYLGSRSIIGLPHYEAVRISRIRPGIDLLFHGAGKELEYDFVVQPGADPASLRLKYESAGRPALASNGDLILRRGGQELRQREPRVWQEIGGRRHEIECRYRVSASGEVRFALASYDRSKELVIDPVLSYSTFLAGNNYDYVYGIAVDTSGNAYVVGSTSSTNFPVTTGSPKGNYDAFVSKLNPSGTALAYSTFIGGAGNDQANGIALDNLGNAYVAGWTASSGFPFTINSYVLGSDAFVAKLNSTGALTYATALAGNSADSATAIAVDSSGAAYVTGTTSSANFPATAGAYRTTSVGAIDSFAAKLNSSGQISYATYLGGASDDTATSIAIDSSGDAFVAGWTGSSNYPTTAGAYTVSFVGAYDGFVTKLNPSGTALLYSTFLGGLNQDYIYGLALDAAGNAYVTGATASSDFPTTPGSFSTVKPSQTYYYSAFVTKLNSAGAALGYSLFLGGNSGDQATGIAVDTSGVAYVTGTAQSTNFPVTPGALRTRPSGYCCGSDSDQSLVKVSNDGSALSYATLMGSTSSSDQGVAVALDGNNGVYLAGTSYLTNYPSPNGNYPTTAGAFQTTISKSSSYYYSGVVAKIDFGSPALCNPSVSPTSQNILGRGGPFSFSLTLSPGCPWETLISDTSMITLNNPKYGVVSSSPVAISGIATQNNNTSSSRMGTVSIGAATFTLNQAPGSCQDPVISPLSLSFDSSGGIHNVSLTLPSGCQWTTSASSPWVSVTVNPSGTGPATLTVFAGQNSFSTRNATLTIAGLAIPVTQTGSNCTASATATPTSFAAMGGTGILRITTTPANCYWNAYNATPWIQLASNATSGQGAGSVPFIIASNPGQSARSGSILIADLLININQNAGPAGMISGYTLSTIAGGGSGTPANRGDGGPALSAVLNPTGLVFNPANGNLYVVDSPRVRVITPDGNINAFAGGGAATAENVPATSALLTNPSYVGLDSSSAVFVNDNGTRVRRISQGNIATFAGGINPGSSGDNGAATLALLNQPQGIVSDQSGNTYIADANNNRVRRVNSGTITNFAGGGNSGLGDGGQATSAQLAQPFGLAFGGGSLYIGDSSNGRVRKVTQNIITTVAGGGNGGDGGPATSAYLYGITGVALNPLGELLMAEGWSSRIRKVGLDGILSTVYSGYQINALTTDSASNIYFSDSYYGVIRKLTAQGSFCTYTVANPLSVALIAIIGSYLNAAEIGSAASPLSFGSHTEER